jgi:hypothetical protein
LELPSLKGETVALIVDYVYKEDISDYLWTAICQQCGDRQLEVTNAEAKKFVKSHNKGCGSTRFKKKGE